MKKIFIYSNAQRCPEHFRQSLEKLLTDNGFVLTDASDPELDFAVSVGGDGTFLNAVKAIGYRSTPVIGINTGHLGFFSELAPEESGKLIELLKTEKYQVQRHRTIKTVVQTEQQSFELAPAVNDVGILLIFGAPFISRQIRKHL